MIVGPIVAIYGFHAKDCDSSAGVNFVPSPDALVVRDDALCVDVGPALAPAFASADEFEEVCYAEDENEGSLSEVTKSYGEALFVCEPLRDVGLVHCADACSASFEDGYASSDGGSVESDHFGSNDVYANHLLVDGLCDTLCKDLADFSTEFANFLAASSDAFPLSSSELSECARAAPAFA